MRLQKSFNQSTQIKYRFACIQINLNKTSLVFISLQQMQKIIVCLALIVSISSACHYSCLTCSSDLYTSCITCNQGSLIDVVSDPNTMPSVYWSSVYPTGTCLSTHAQSKANPLGILLFIVVVACCAFFRTKQSFYLLCTYQTYGLYNLVQIAWVNPLGFVLEAQQYFMTLNMLSYGFKTVDYVLNASKNFRLSYYLKTTAIGQNLALIAVLTLISLALLVVLLIITVRRKKQAKPDKKDVIFQPMISVSESSKRGHLQNQETEQPSQCCKTWKNISQQYLVELSKFLICVLFLLMQQTSLVLLVTLVYSINTAAIALCILYLHILVFVMSYAYYYRIQYFSQKNILYINFAKKIILPVLIVVPIINQYLFFLFTGLFIIFEIIADIYNGSFQQFSRMMIYKCAEILTVLLLIIYYVVESTTSTSSPSKAAAIAVTFMMALNFFLFVGVQVPVAIKNKYFSSNSQSISEKQMKEVRQQDTIIEINQNDKRDKYPHVQIVDISSNKSNNRNNHQDHQEDNNENEQSENTNQNQDLQADRYKNQKTTEEEQPTPVVPPQKKKKRRQIIDKELRLRYGI